MKQITANFRFKDVEIVLVVNLSTWDSVPQSNTIWHGAIQVELTAYKRSPKGMRNVRPNEPSVDSMGFYSF